MAKKPIQKKRRTRVTTALESYLKQDHELIDLVVFIYGLAERADKATKVAAKALADTAPSEEEKREYESKAKRGGGVVKRYKKFVPLIREVIFCRAVDNFLAYLSNVLILTHQAKTELLKSDEKISFQDIIEADTREELIEVLIERRVTDLSYMGFQKLNEETTKRFRVPIATDKTACNRVERLVELRNLFVHAEGIVNRRVVKKVPALSKFLGKKYQLSSTVINDSLYLNEIALRFDQKMRKKFKIEPSVLFSVQLGDLKRLRT